ncbi:hypothetical protein J3458_013387 [Metarhizium acridum]|uniref:uncharacterized protein n=1 Tax=Metarhizium acridum TaxID=92637 RepID=UPI001C6BC5D9|nr:hypothetical protein J3458_013387 [Metarhizium acridum]
MLLIGKILPAHVPEVYALYSTKNDAGGILSIILSWKESLEIGLTPYGTALIQEKKNEIAKKLRSYPDTVRSHPSPGYFGCIGRRQFEDSMFWIAPDDNISSSAISGPFDSESLLNRALIEKYLHNGGLNQKAAFYRRALPLILRGYRPIFTHGDLQRKNLIIRENGVVVLIDWEAAGWYPEYWEYAMAVFACGAWQDDWHEFIGQVLVEYPIEYAWSDMPRRELWS